MGLASALGSRKIVYRWAWILFWAGVLCPAPGFLYTGLWGLTSGLSVVGYVIAWSKALPAAIGGGDAFRAFVLALSFFSNVVFLGTRSIGGVEVSRGYRLLIIGSLATNASLALLFPKLLVIPGFWLWLAAWGALAWALLEIPATRDVPEKGDDPRVPQLIWIWLGCLVFWMGVSVLNHVSPLPLEADAAAPAPAVLRGYFNDPGDLFSVADRIRFDGKLTAFEKETSCQIAVAAYPRVPAGSVEDFTLKTAADSGLGRKGRDNGAILFTFADARVARLEVGYGLEGALPDITAFHILERELGPRFAKGEYAAGLDASLEAVFTAVRGEYGKGRTPGLLRLAWRRIVAMGKRLRYEVWPFLRRSTAGGRVAFSFWGGLLGIGCASGMVSLARLARGVAVGLKNLVHGKDTDLGEIDVLAMRDTVIVAVFLALLLGGTAYLVAGGGGFGGAGALITW